MYDTTKCIKDGDVEYKWSGSCLVTVETQNQRNSLRLIARQFIIACNHSYLQPRKLFSLKKTYECYWAVIYDLGFDDYGITNRLNQRLVNRVFNRGF